MKTDAQQREFRSTCGDMVLLLTEIEFSKSHASISETIIGLCNVSEFEAAGGNGHAKKHHRCKKNYFSASWKCNRTSVNIVLKFSKANFNLGTLIQSCFINKPQ